MNVKMREGGYMEEVSDLMEAIGDDYATDLVKNKEMVKALAERVMGIPMFKSSEKLFREFCAALDKLPKEKRLEAAWLHFLKKSVEAPTYIHLRGVVILCIPALWHVMCGLYEKGAIDCKNN